MKRKVIFLTLGYTSSRGIYTDLIKEFYDKGNEVYVVTPTERRKKEETHTEDVDGIKILKVKTLNLQKTNIIEKGLSTLLIENQFKSAIKKYWSNIEFDLIIYSTPPITFSNVIKYLKEKNKSITYLMLKDIFPQNAVDIGIIKKNSILHKMFSKKEKTLYENSDFIGCMSLANKEFLEKNNPNIKPSKIEILPNTITPLPLEDFSKEEKEVIRNKYNLPIDKTIFIYGGNLGKPQGIDFLIECVNANEDISNNHILIIGSGTEYNKLKQHFDNNEIKNSSLFNYMNKEDYDKIVKACDVGLVFLDNRFTIPNFPSRILSYMEFAMPILAATDKNTDVGLIIENNNFGKWCESNNVNLFVDNMNHYSNNKIEIEKAGKRGRKFLDENYTSEMAFNIIMNHNKEQPNVQK